MIHQWRSETVARIADLSRANVWGGHHVAAGGKVLQADEAVAIADEAVHAPRNAVREHLVPTLTRHVAVQHHAPLLHVAVVAERAERDADLERPARGSDAA